MTSHRSRRSHRRNVVEARYLLAADLNRMAQIAAGFKTTAPLGIAKDRRVSRNTDQLAAAARDRRNRSDQSAAVRMHRLARHLAARSLLDDPPSIHHRHSVTELAHNSKVMSYEQQGSGSLRHYPI